MGGMGGWFALGLRVARNYVLGGTAVIFYSLKVQVVDVTTSMT